MKNKKCKCDFCKRVSPELSRVLRKLDRKDGAIINELVGRVMNAEDDAGYYNALYHGDWPSSQVTVLRDAIKWALGENGEFAQRKDGQGAYWWRSELRKRAGEFLNKEIEI